MKGRRKTARAYTPDQTLLLLPMSGRAAMVSGVLSALASWAVYSVGSDRAFDYDSSVTVANFVVTPSPLDVFQRQIVFNNHPLFSFAEHLIYSLTGLQSEVPMRLLPIAAGAVAVGALVSYLSWTLGLLPGFAGGLVLATNPTFVGATREVRGYSLMTLMVLLGSLVLVRMARSQSANDSPRMGRAYMAATAAAIGTHLFAVLAVPAHLAALVGKRRLTWSWCMRLLTATLLGTASYTLLLSTMHATARGRKGFTPQFPVDLTRDLLGGSVWTAVVLGAVVAVGAYRLRSWRVLGLTALSIFIPLAFIWIVVAPADLYSRFLVWLVPGIAVLIALAVAWRPPLVLFVTGACLFSWLTLTAPGYTTDSLSNRAAAGVIDAAAARGETACAAGYSAETLPVYTRRFLTLSNPSQLSQCAILVILEPDEPSHHPWLVAASPILQSHRELPAQTPGVVLMRSGP